MGNHPNSMLMADYSAEDQRLTNPPSYQQSEGMSPVPVARSQAGVVSFLSSNERKGPWQLPRKFRALAVLGSVELDLRGAEVGYGFSEIEAVSFMGSVEITVPPDVTVDCDGDNLMGSFTLRYDGRVSPVMASREKTIRITGTAYLGPVTVIVKGPDEKNLFQRMATKEWWTE